MSNIYLQLEASTGNLFEYSKEPKEGFDKHESVNPNTKQTVVSYRRYHKEGVFGRLLGFGPRSTEMGGKNVLNVSIVLEAINDDRYFINFPLQNAKGDVQDYATSAISYLPNLVEGAPYRFFPYAIDDKATGRKNYGVSFKHARLSDNAQDDVNKISRLTFEVLDKETGAVKTPGDIPAIEWEIVMDKPSPVKKKRNNYLWKVLQDHKIGGENIGGGTKKTFNSKEEAGSDPANAPEPTTVKEEPVKEQPKKGMAPNADFDSQKPESKPMPAATAEEDEDDDLPF